MDPNFSQRAEELFHAALKLDPDRRDEFVSEACGADEQLRFNVEALLAQRVAAGTGPTESFPESTVAQANPVTQLGPYRIEGLLGTGGMGRVYRARDTRLGRAVAIKFVDERFSARFEREAAAISRLNHPHVCTLYDIGPDYLVMELLEGETLASRLRKGPLPMEQLLRFGQQIAAALAEAHARGIVHRDLKPGNIMITRSGVKVLDFGLAKVHEESGAAATEAATLTASQSIVGTLAYMSP